MRLNRRGRPDDGADVDVDATGDLDTDEASAGVSMAKGRPTPKRRDSQGRRGPVSAPKTRKEALARQRQLDRERKTAKASAGTPAAKPRSAAEQRAALKRGDASALPRRDQGPTRKLARDYVDSRRMASNYLLWLFALLVVSAFVPGLQILQIVALLLFIALLGEWFIVGRRINAMAMERYGKTQGGPMTIGFYAGSRAYLPRRWRLPGPTVERGDEI